VGAVRVVLEPKPGLPTDPTDPRAFIDVFTDISGLFVINNESGLVRRLDDHDVTVPAIDPVARPDGHAHFGAILPRDAALLARMAAGNNVPGHTFTVDGRKPRFPSASDHFPDAQTKRGPDLPEHGRVQCAAAIRCPRLLGIQLPGKPTGFIHSMSCPSPAEFRTVGRKRPTPSPVKGSS